MKFENVFWLNFAILIVVLEVIKVEGSFTWLGRLYETSDFFDSNCTAVLVASKVLLTSNKCSGLTIVTFGCDQGSAFCETRNILRQIVHPNFSPFELDGITGGINLAENDILFLELVTPVDVEIVKPISFLADMSYTNALIEGMTFDILTRDVEDDILHLSADYVKQSSCSSEMGLDVGYDKLCVDNLQVKSSTRRMLQSTGRRKLQTQIQVKLSGAILIARCVASNTDILLGIATTQPGHLNGIINLDNGGLPIIITRISFSSGIIMKKFSQLGVRSEISSEVPYLPTFCQILNTNGVPDEWECSIYYFDADDGCDCNCGAYDPDCGKALPYSFGIYGCPDYPVACDFLAHCDPPPPEWTCDPSDYGNQVACNCGCGAPDPDCAIPGISSARCFITGLTECVVDSCFLMDAVLGLVELTTGPILV